MCSRFSQTGLAKTFVLQRTFAALILDVNVGGLLYTQNRRIDERAACSVSFMGMKRVTHMPHPSAVFYSLIQ